MRHPRTWIGYAGYMTNIIPLIEPAGVAVAPFSIGFVKLSMAGGEEHAELAGSGVLVAAGPVHGILTAARTCSNPSRIMERSALFNSQALR